MSRAEIESADVRAALAQRGYWLGALGSVKSAELLAWACRLGNPISDPRDGCVVKTVAPAPTASAPPNTLSSRYGVGAFPFHTDGAHWRAPPGLLLIYCVHEGSGARPTHLHDTSSWELDGEERRVLRNEPWCVVEVPKPFLCTHLGPDDALRVNYDCMRPSGSASRAVAIIADRLAKRSAVSISWSPGNVLLIDNTRMLHARGTALMPDPDRQLTRILLRKP
jgi:L-asparagine oxygenase